jgi:hypothetical protein
MTPTPSRRAFLGAAAVTFVAPSAFAAPSRKLVLVAGRPSHGPLEHEFNAGVRLIHKCLAKTAGLDVAVHLNGWPQDDNAFAGADGILCFADGGPGHPLVQFNHLEIIGKLMNQGVGLMCAHYGVEVPKDKGGKEFLDWIGGYYEHEWSCNPMWSPEFKEFSDHPICRGVKPFSVRDEWYFNMRFRPDMKGITPILSARPDDAVRKGPYVYPKGPYEHIVKASGRSEVMMWAGERQHGGRGVGFTGGHFHKNWMNDDFRKVFLNGLLWVAKADVPETGVESTVTEEDLMANLDPKGKKK